MFKLVVLSALVAVALAAPHPGLLAAAPVASLAYTAPAVAVPTAVSHQSRVDVHSKPIIATTYTAPAVVAAPAVAAVHAAPLAYTAPAVAAVAAPALSTYSTHGLINTAGIAAPLTYGIHGVHAALL